MESKFCKALLASLFCSLASAASLGSGPVKFEYGGDFDFLLDNLEESARFWPTRTLFSGKLSPEIGFSFYNQRVMLGGYFILNMGDRYPQQGGLSLYYEVLYKDIKALFGIFPRKQWTIYDGGALKYSRLFFREDFLFNNPFSSGILFQYSPKRLGLTTELLFDWYGGNLKKRIDEFFVQGLVRKGFFNELLFIGGAFLLYHSKNEELLNADGNNFDTYLLDRIYYEVFIGSELASVIPHIESMQFKFSNLSSLERKRRLSTGLDPASNLIGWQFDFGIRYKGFGIDNSLYFGNNQYKYFMEYGEAFYSGLPFYQSSLYDRLEVYYEYRNSYFRGRIGAIFHFTKEGFSHQQMLTISLDSSRLFGHGS